MQKQERYEEKEKEKQEDMKGRKKRKGVVEGSRDMEKQGKTQKKRERGGKNRGRAGR